MDWYISYFYHIRNMPTTMTPVSTAMYDPKWYHENQGNDHIYKDKRGVVNGIRCNGLSPRQIYNQHSMCPKEGSKACPHLKTNSCPFLPAYEKYLNSLDFNTTIQTVERACLHVNPGCEQICLMVFETFENPCSERIPLLRWFASNNCELRLFKGRL